MKKEFLKVVGGSRGEVESIEVVNMSYEEIIEWGLKEVGGLLEELKRDGYESEDYLSEFMYVYEVEGMSVIVGLDEESSIGFYEVEGNVELKELGEDYEELENDDIWSVLGDIDDRGEKEGRERKFYFGEDY
jgi:hypothetical protein